MEDKIEIGDLVLEDRNEDWEECYLIVVTGIAGKFAEGYMIEQTDEENEFLGELAFIPEEEDCDDILDLTKCTIIEKKHSC